MSNPRIIIGDAVDVMASWPDNSIDAIACDPPYGLSFMGKDFDKLGGPAAQKAWHARWAAEAFRVCLPGAHVVAFGGQRTIHHLTVALEGVGFQVRELFGWLQWQGFPKSSSLPLALDRHLGKLDDREVVGSGSNFGASRAADGKIAFGDYAGEWSVTAPATPEAEAAAGWGSALKPCLEPAIIVRKPLADAEGRPLTLAANWLMWGTGGLNIDATRHPYSDPSWPGPGDRPPDGRSGASPWSRIGISVTNDEAWDVPALGRWPANVYACPACDCPSWPGPAGRIDPNSGWAKSGTEGNPAAQGFAGSDTFKIRERTPDECQPSPLGRWPSNVFATPKPSRAEREAGCEGIPATTAYEVTGRTEGSAGMNSPRAGIRSGSSTRPGGGHDIRNGHPTVKPLRLMAQLVKMITPTRPGAVVVDPFLGSGTTAAAAVLEGYDVIGIERDPEYARIAEARVRWALAERGRATAQGDLFAPAAEPPPDAVDVETFDKETR